MLIADCGIHTVKPGVFGRKSCEKNIPRLEKYGDILRLYTRQTYIAFGNQETKYVHNAQKHALNTGINTKNTINVDTCIQE